MRMKGFRRLLNSGFLYLVTLSASWGAGELTIYNYSQPAHSSSFYNVSVKDPSGSWQSVHVYDSYNDIVLNSGACPTGQTCPKPETTRQEDFDDWMTKRNHWASFDVNNPNGVEIRVETLICGALSTPYPIRNDVIKPFETPAWGIIWENSTTFTIKLWNPTSANWPRQFYVKLPSPCHRNHPLFIFFNPREYPNTTVKTCPNEDIPNGVFHIGAPNTVSNVDQANRDGNNDPQVLKITSNNETYCIPGGAYVQGRIEIAGATGTKIIGRGILSGIGTAHYTSDSWGEHLIYAGGGSAKHTTVEGITLVDASRANIEIYQRATIDNVKMLSWHWNTDGITTQGLPGNKSSVSNVFVKVNDDAIKPMYGDVTFSKVVAWQQSVGSIVQLAWNNHWDASGATVEKLRLIEVDRNDANVPLSQRPNPDANYSLISSMNLMAGKIENVVFDDVDAEVTPHSFAVIQLEDDIVYGDMARMMNDTCTPPGGGPDENCHELDGNGRIIELSFRNIDIAGDPRIRGGVVNDDYRGKIDINAGSNYSGSPDPNHPDTIFDVELYNVRVDGKVVSNSNSGTTQHWINVFRPMTNGWPGLCFTLGC